MSRLRTLIVELGECLAEAETMTVQPKEGDILYSSWGYDQTNIDFYKVLKVTKSSVKIGKVPKKVVGGHGTPSEDVVPIPTAQPEGKLMTKRFKQDPYHPERYFVKINSYAWAYLWDGKPKSRTGAGYGH